MWRRGGGLCHEAEARHIDAGVSAAAGAALPRQLPARCGAADGDTCRRARDHTLDAAVIAQQQRMCNRRSGCDGMFVSLCVMFCIFSFCLCLCLCLSLFFVCLCVAVSVSPLTLPSLALASLSPSLPPSSSRPPLSEAAQARPVLPRLRRGAGPAAAR